MCKLIQTFFVAVFACGGLSAQTPAWQPSPGHTQMPIWPKEPPDAQPVPGSERVYTEPEKPVLGETMMTWVENVSQPTMTVYSPKGDNTGVAVIVFPGGGYQELAIDMIIRCVDTEEPYGSLRIFERRRRFRLDLAWDIRVANIRVAMRP